MAGLEGATGNLGVIPYFVLGAYLVLLLVFGIVGYLKSTDSEEDYYLAGRSQGWIVSSLTIMATFFSSFALLGAPGMVYREGVVFALFSLNVPLAGAAVYILGSKISRLGRARGYVTPGDMIAEYYGSRVALRLLAALIGILYAVPYVVMQIKAGGYLSQQMFPGENSFQIGCVLLSLVTMFYIMIGGMRSVAWSDVVQGLLLVGGMLVAGVATVAVLGGPAGFSQKIASFLEGFSDHTSLTALTGVFPEQYSCTSRAKIDLHINLIKISFGILNKHCFLSLTTLFKMARFHA